MIANTDFIKAEDIAAGYQQIIGSKFKIFNDSCTDVDEDKLPLVLYITRTPYKLPNINTESVQVAFSTYVDCGNTSDYNATINELAKLVGFKTATFRSQGKDYKLFSFIDFSRPLTDPVVDSGVFKQQLTLTGTCLITGNSGAIVGNEITTHIVFNPEDQEECFEGEIQVLNCVTNLVKTPESPTLANDVVAKTFGTLQAYSYTYTILLLKDKVSERLLKAAENIEPFKLNERIDIRKDFPAIYGEPFSNTKDLCVTSITLNHAAGAFISVQLTLQDRLAPEDLEINEEEDDG